MKNKLYRWLIYGHTDLEIKYRWHESQDWMNFSRFDTQVLYWNPEIKTVFYDQNNKIKNITIYNVKEN